MNGPYSESTYRVTLGSICAGVVVTGNVITNAAPVFQKFIGARLDRFKVWVERKGGMVTHCPSSLRQGERDALL
jgi:hypothetical protein